MDADLIKILEKELEKENFDSRKKRGLLQTYITAKYRFDVEKYILMGVSKGAPTLLFNKFKEEDPIFSKRISFRIFDLWFSKLKREIESGKSNSVNYFNFVHNRNLAETDKETYVAEETTKKVKRETTEVKIKEDAGLSAYATENDRPTIGTFSDVADTSFFNSYDPLAISSQTKTQTDSIWNRIPKPELPLKFLDVTGLEEHKIFDNMFCYRNYVQIIEKGENKGLLVDQKGFLFDPYTSRPGSDFYLPEDHYNLVDPLPIPINMTKPMLIVDAITFQYLKPDCLNRPAPATMHSMDLGNYLTHDYRQTILTKKTEEIFYQIENNL
ncbi:MAG: hypothetical protein IJ254_08370 [Succinivibrio sp.]|nr:hypothetical protein [Succinivibrio sp.]